ncbi:sensory box histidine kinase/response regulator [Lachnospiraceae bacterium KM106-2]|nr:sensory box histidine kinase/response regulator [Lachnospiraceae bacterium KM106-2]
MINWNEAITIFPVLYLDRAGNIVKANDLAKRVFFSDVEEKRYDKLLKNKELIEFIKKHRQGEKVHSKDLLHGEKAKSSYEWYYAEMMPETEDGREGDILFIKDVTESYHAQTFLESTMQVTKDIILFFNRHNYLTYCSALTAAYLGYESHEKAEGMPFMKLEEKGIRKEILLEIMNAVENNKEFSKQVKLEFYQGKPSLYQLEAYQILISDEKYGYLLYARDMAETESDVDHLKMSQHMVNEMMESISHELRTPLNAVLGSAEILSLDRNITKHGLMHLQNIKRSSAVITNIINGISCYQQLESGEVPVEYDFYEELDQLLLSVQNKMNHREIDFDMEVDPEIPKTIIGVKGYIQFILQQLFYYITENEEVHKVHFYIKRINLDIGAKIIYQMECDATEHGGLKSWYAYLLCKHLVDKMGARLRCWQNQSNNLCIQLSLDLKSSSNGQILEYAKLQEQKIQVLSQDNLFVKRIHRIAKRLGVKCVTSDDQDSESYTHVLIDEQEFQLREYKEHKILKGRKILFVKDLKLTNGYERYVDDILYAPVYEYKLANILLRERTVKQRQQIKSDLMFRTQNVRLLVVDDSEVNRMITTHMLSQFQIQCDEAESGYEAINLIRKNQYDMVLLDYLMPDFDGKQTLRYIRANITGGSELVVIMLSANMVSETKGMLLGIHANDVLSKPLELESLSDILIKWLPKDKIFFENQDEKQVVKQEDNILNLLKEIDELDVNQGVQNVLNHVEEYVIILKMSAKNIQEQLTKMQILYEQQQYEKMQLHYHSLKGIFINIGAKDLVRMSQEGETYAKEGETESILYSYESYVFRIKRFYSKLMMKLAMIKACNEDETENKKLIDQERMKELKTNLKDSLKRYEYKEILKNLNEMMPMVKKGEKDSWYKLKQFVYDFDYEEAARLLELIDRGEA